MKPGEEKILLHEVPEKHEQEEENTEIREIFSQNEKNKKITNNKRKSILNTFEQVLKSIVFNNLFTFITNTFF